MIFVVDTFVMFRKSCLIPILSALVSLLFLAGCGALAEWGKSNLNVAGARTLYHDDLAVSQVDLVQVLVSEDALPDFKVRHPDCIQQKKADQNQQNPMGAGKQQGGGASGQQVSLDVDTKRNLSTEEARECIAAAFESFDYFPVADGQLRRNQVVGQLRAASEVACTLFTTHLNTLQADTNFLTGVLATGLAGAGAIATPATSARFLSGAGAIVSGGRAEFNADLFYKEAVPVIVNAIGVKRAEIRAELDRNMLKSEREYPISNAVSDVFRYNDACSLVEGFSTANQALTLLDHPGLDELNRALVQTNVSRTILDNQNIVDARILRSDGSVDADALAKLGVTYGPRIPDSGSSDGFSALQAAQAAIVTGAAELRSSFDRAMADNAIATALAPPTPTVAMELDAIIKASTAALADSCQPKIVTAQAALTNARLAFSSSTLTDKSGLRLDLSQQQAIADGLQYAVRIYENNVVGRMANAHSSFKRAVATFQGSDKSPSHATDLTNAIAALRVALVTLSGEVAVGQAKQPSCLG